MYASQWIAGLLLLLGGVALGWRRQTFVEYEFASDAVMLLVGVSSLLCGGLLMILGFLRHSVEY